ncbi:MAG: polysaccharide biosynthesis C-terminal domain-containing protein, partial [Elusimicrobia bacterium]|nr:polysaccharide biosynthesis C-terminal domain-containing protein [Elusimicrobiota bacterium]
VVRNTIFNAIGRFWSILVALFLTPYIIGHIGIERYGIWAIVGVITGYFGLLDFGIGTSFVKYISEFYAKKDYGKINQVVNTGFVFYSILAIFIIAVAFLFVHSLLAFFKIPAYLYNETVFVFLLGIMIFGVSNALSPFQAIQGGLQRMDITNKVSIAISVPTIVGTVFFLEAGYGLPGLIVNNAIILVISSIVHIIIAFKILQELRFNSFLFTKEMFKKLFDFGYKMQVARISSMISIHLDKLLITYFLSIGFVTFYELGSAIVEKTKSIALLFVSALIPAFSEIYARGEKERLIDAYARCTKYLGFFVLPLFTLIIISAPHIMMIWMGPGYEKSVWVIQILGFGWLCAVLSSVRATVVQAIAKPGIEMRAGLVTAIFNIPLSIIFIIHFGFIGAAVGTSIALLLGTIHAFIKLHQEIQLSTRYFIRTTILKTSAICVIIGLFLWGLTSALQGVLFEPTRIMSSVVFIVQAMLFFSIYLKLMTYIKPLDNIDRMLLQDKLPFGGRLLIRFSR